MVSVGNVLDPSETQLAPPADCEAAIVVGGRGADPAGQPGDPCLRCLNGPGPDGMLKPDVSWFSELRMIGGISAVGSSYPTALVSSLAAHTFANLKTPTPDLVKALLINAAERPEHHPTLGWGSPYNGALPWSCQNGTVTLAWTAFLQPGSPYYWSDIPIPPELIEAGRLRGKAKLTAVLKPLLSPLGGANYFATRLETSLTYQNQTGKWTSLLGTMLESTLPETDARNDLKKWQPIRRHAADFSRGAGHRFTGNHFRLYARVYSRDLYQFSLSNNDQLGPQEVAFVLTLEGMDEDSAIYQSMANLLGNFVESAVLNQEIEIDNNR